MTTIVWRVEHLDQVDSTNSYLRDRVTDDLDEGAVVVTEYQRGGRGRLERQWESPPGESLLCSILLRPAIENSDLQLVVASVALAARAALGRLGGLAPDLKWPNDLMVGEKKLAGVLADVVATAKGLAVVVGLGVNLTYHGPDAALATSVVAETGVRLRPREVLDAVLAELAPRRALLETTDGRGELRAQYASALATISRRVRVELPGRTIEGVATGVDESGQLLVEVDGVVTAFNAGDVVHLRTTEPR